jgi:hypothetical protein
MRVGGGTLWVSLTFFTSASGSSISLIGSQVTVPGFAAHCCARSGTLWQRSRNAHPFYVRLFALQLQKRIVRCWSCPASSETRRRGNAPATLWERLTRRLSLCIWVCWQPRPSPTCRWEHLLPPPLLWSRAPDRTRTSKARPGSAVTVAVEESLACTSLSPNRGGRIETACV